MLVLLVFVLTLSSSAISDSDEIEDIEKSLIAQFNEAELLCDQYEDDLEEDSNETVRCPRRCKPTCEMPNPPNCPLNRNCTCSDGYIYPDKRNNTCIPIYQCPRNISCNGDFNAIIQSRVYNRCPPTCKEPNQGRCDIKLPNNLPGCVCSYGYILSDKDGYCIPLEMCPGGNPCGENRTFASCTSCPYNPCPYREFAPMYPCDPIWPCPAGCICEGGYKRNGDRCVLPEDCPPFRCTRPNEEYDRCPSPCYSDRCSDIPKWSQPCNLLTTCYPRCRCKPLYARAKNGTCIPMELCPPSSPVLKT